MTGDNFFKLGQSGEKIALNKLREKLDKKEIESNPALSRLFSIFDEDKNKVLDKKEIQGIWDTFNLYATSNDNNILDTDEVSEFLNVVNIENSEVTVNDLQEFLKASQESKISLSEEQAQNLVVTSLLSDVNHAYMMWHAHSGSKGIVTEGYDKLKNYFDGELGSDNVTEVLALQAEAGEFLMKAKEGNLSKKEYYLENVDHLKKMIKRRLFVKDEATGISFIDRKRDKLSQKQLEKIVDEYLDKYIAEDLASINLIKKAQMQLTQLTEEGTETFLENFLNNALEHTKENGRTLDNVGVRDKFKLGNSIPIEYNTDEPMEFREVFKLERGREFSKESLEEYFYHQNDAAFKIEAYNSYKRMVSSVDVLMDGAENIKDSNDQLIQFFNMNFPTEVFAKLKEIINKNKFPISVAKDEAGNITLDISAYENNPELGKRTLTNIARIALQEKAKILEELMGGNPEDVLLEIQQRSEQLYDTAYGNDFPSALVQAMENDNSTIIQRVTGGISTGGMLMMAAGMLLAIPTGGTSLIGAGGAVAMGGMGAEMALCTAEHFSKDLVTSEEEKAYRDMMIMNTGGLLIGMGAGKTSDILFKKYIDPKLVELFDQAVSSGNRMEFVRTVLKQPELVGKFLNAATVKVGADFAISMWGDMALKWGFDTNTELSDALKANIIGALIGTGADVGNLAGKLGPKHSIKSIIDSNKPVVEPPKIDVKKVKETIEVKDNQQVDKQPTSRELSLEGEISDKELAYVKEILSSILDKDYSDDIKGLNKEYALIFKHLFDRGNIDRWLSATILTRIPIRSAKILTPLLKKSYPSQFEMNMDYYTLLHNTDLQGNILSPVLEYAVNNNYSNSLEYLVDSDGIKANLFQELQETSVLSPELLLDTVSRCTEENFENIKSEYLTIINKFKESPELLKLYEQKHINFEQLLNLEDYKKIAIPIEDRKVENINTEEYQAELKARLENPHNPIKKETLDWALHIAALAQTHRSHRVSANYKPSKLYPIEPLAVVKKDAPSVTLPTAKEAISTLKKKGKVEINIENTGGLNPTRNEKPIIEAGYESQLGVVEKSGIKIKYGERISWDNARIARDIMQNFYDGNGHTLEGVDISVQRTEDGYYTVKIDGQGHYSHTRLESLGDSSKTDSDDAGNYGEGTRIVAVNLLAKKDTPYVKYACGDWNVKFEKSSDEVSPDMVESLNKNPETLEGNYIEFKTKDLDLVEQVLNSKDYFYHPYNKDFQGFDYENEFFGVKKLNKKEKGNIYVVQRFETDKGIENGLDEFSFVCKTMPKNEELVALNGHKLSLEAGRDRKALTNYEIKEIAKYYLKSMPDKELLGLIASFKDDWILGKEYDKHPNILLEAAIDAAISKGIGFDADNTNFVAVGKNTSPTTLDYINNMGVIPVIEELGDLGISRDMGSVDYIVHKPTKEEAKKVHLIDEATKIISENRDFKSKDQVLPKDAAGATIMCKDGSMLGVGEAILGAGGYLGHWLQPKMLNVSFTSNLMTKLHEITHKFGGDTSEEFSIALLNLQETLFKEFAHNPAVLQKMRVIDALFKNSDNYVKEGVFDVEKFKKDIMKELDVDKTYSPYHEKGLLDKSQENKGYWKDSYFDGMGMLLEDPNQGSYLQRVANGFIGQRPRYEFVSTDKKFMEFKPFEKKSTALNTTIPTVSEAFRELQTKGAVNIEIPNHGGMKAVNTEKPVILEEDEGKLGVTKKSKIKIRYGAKTNWSDFKIARDIMQNFYDGHGNTLEGVGVNITQNADGSYTVKISGDGNYSYNHLEALGASGKDAGGDNAGYFGEGTRIVAVNLLSKLDTPYVKYACGDWEMTFGRNSDNMEVADMTQTLTKAETPLKGNIIEFKTTNENLITEILQSKDYFYHPENPDFHDFTFENDEIGIKFLDNPNEKGHLYMVQRYESETPHQDLKGVTIVLKKRPQLADDIGLSTDRDRLRLKHKFLKNVASELASSNMSNEDYIKLLATFKDYYAVDKNLIQKIMWNYPENKKTLEEHFAAGLIKAAANKGIKIDYKKEKLAYVEGNDDFAIKYLAEQGYRFVPQEMSDLGIPSAKQIYENEHPLHSIEPTKVENKKLDILCEAIALLSSKSDINRPDFYMFNGKDCNAGEVKASKKSDSPKVFLDREFLRNADFYNCISKIIGENLELKYNSKEPSSYSYELTDLMAEEINMFLQDYTLAPKLKALKEIFDSIKE